MRFNFSLLTLTFTALIQAVEIFTCSCAQTSDLGLAPSGYAVQVVQKSTLTGTEIAATILNNTTGNWGPPAILSTAPPAYFPCVKVIGNIDISAVAIWSEVNSGNSKLFGAMMPNIESGWTVAVQISDSSEIVLSDYQLALTDSGDIVASWRSVDSSVQCYLRSSKAVLNSSNTWTESVNVLGPI